MNKEVIKENFLGECKTAFHNCYQKLQNRKIVLFGAGSYGILMIRGLKDNGMYENIYAVCDNNEEKWGKTLEGIPIKSITEVMEEIDGFVVIISSQYESEIRQSLKQYSLEIFEKPSYEDFVERMLSFYVYKTTYIVNEEIAACRYIEDYCDSFIGKEEEVLSLLEDEESRNIVRKRVQFYKTGKLKYIREMPVRKKPYFEEEYYNYIGENETFIDCGAYTGDTVEAFIRCVRNKYSKIYAFEPDTGLFEILSNKVKKKKYANIELYKCATGKEEGELKFNQIGTAGSAISEKGNVNVVVRCLDNLISDKVSWIKMDIEGAERETLQGAERIIKKYKPKLAVCIYHKCEDMFELPIYLHMLVPEYKFKIRHHSNALEDMVLYADIYD